MQYYDSSYFHLVDLFAMIRQLLHRLDCDYFGIQNTRQKDFPGFKFSITEAFIKKDGDIIYTQMQNHLWN